MESGAKKSEQEIKKNTSHLFSSPSISSHSLNYLKVWSSHPSQFKNCISYEFNFLDFNEPGTT